MQSTTRLLAIYALILAILVSSWIAAARSGYAAWVALLVGMHSPAPVEPEPVVLTVQAPPLDDGVAVPAEAWQWHRMIATAYTDGPESTGKRPGHPLYGITR